MRYSLQSRFFSAPQTIFVLGLMASLIQWGCGAAQDPAFGEKESVASFAVKVDPNSTSTPESQDPSVASDPSATVASAPVDPDQVFDDLANAPVDTEIGTTVAANESGSTTTSEDNDTTSSGGTTSGNDDKSHGRKSGDSVAHKDDDATTGTTNSNPGTVVGCPSKSEAKACAEILGVPVTQVHLVSQESDITVQQNGVIAVKLTGNKSRLNLNLAGTAEGAKVKGVCLFLAGNQSTADVKVGLEVGTLVYVGRGNQSQGTVTVAEAGVIQKLAGDLSGNQSRLSITGAGDHPCEKVRTRGNDSSFVCQ